MKKTRKLATLVAAFALSFAVVPQAVADSYDHATPATPGQPGAGSSYTNAASSPTKAGGIANGVSSTYGHYTFDGVLGATRDGKAVDLQSLKYGDVLSFTTKVVVSDKGDSFDTIQNVTLHSNPVNLGNKVVPAGKTTTFVHKLGCELEVGPHSAELNVYPKGETGKAVKEAGFAHFRIVDKAENCGKFDNGFEGTKTGAVASVAAASAGALAAAGAGIVALRRRFS